MDLYQIIVESYKAYGYPLVFLGAFLESIILIGFLLPGSFIVLFGGYFAQQGDLSILPIILLAWMGMFLGDLLNYSLGKGGFYELLKSSKFKRFSKQRTQAENYIREYGVRAIFASHLVGHLRSFICFAAGAVNFSKQKFIVSVFIASLFWSALFALLGYFLGTTTYGIRSLSEKINLIIILLIVIVILLKLLERAFTYIIDLLKHKKN